MICEFHDLLVRRLSIHPPVIRRRLELIFQPVSLRTTVVNSGASYSYRDRQSDEEILYAILDSLAAQMISKSFQQNIVVGGDVNSPITLYFSGLL